MCQALVKRSHAVSHLILTKMLIGLYYSDLYFMGENTNFREVKGLN